MPFPKNLYAYQLATIKHYVPVLWNDLAEVELGLALLAEPSAMNIDEQQRQLAAWDLISRDGQIRVLCRMMIQCFGWLSAVWEKYPLLMDCQDEKIKVHVERLHQCLEGKYSYEMQMNAIMQWERASWTGRWTSHAMKQACFDKEYNRFPYNNPTGIKALVQECTKMVQCLLSGTYHDISALSSDCSRLHRAMLLDGQLADQLERELK